MRRRFAYWTISRQSFTVPKSFRQSFVNRTVFRYSHPGDDPGRFAGPRPAASTRPQEVGCGAGRPWSCVEVSFSREARMLRLGTATCSTAKAFSRSPRRCCSPGVAYVGGYQGAPVSHLLDVLVQAEGLPGRARRARRGLLQRGLRRGDARRVDPLSAARCGDLEVDRRHQRRRRCACRTCRRPGVTGGALIVVGEDYGEGASVIQERTYAYALKSSLLLLDPRPELRPAWCASSRRASRCPRRRTCRRCCSCASARATCAAASCARTTSRRRCRRGT